VSAYDVSVEVAVRDNFDVAALRTLAERVMEGEGVPARTSLAILVTGDDEIRALNRQFLGIDEPTDVLSFPDDADDFIEGETGIPSLGDIAISLPTAARQASANGVSLDLEVGHLLVHGVLHLCGWDHVDDPGSEAAMRAREEWFVPGVKHSQPH
jgi:probable rRNA maturation factor